MTKARKDLISLSDTPYYHITTRCVRRSFLCGYDHETHTDYEHRRQWIVERIRLLASVFAIDICAYAVMSNHYHLVVKISPEQIEALGNHEVIQRWLTVFKGHPLVRDYASGSPLSPLQREFVSQQVNHFRKSLADISCFMKYLNQPISRRANKEDRCKGRFFEQRYTSDPLLTEEALLSCMAYVDLNPIRAKMAETPESSDYTSIQERIKPQFDLAKAIENLTGQGFFQSFNTELKPLLSFNEATTNQDQSGIPFTLVDYLELVDWTGRVIRADKRGAIGSQLPPILKRLNINKKKWLSGATDFESVRRQRFVADKTTLLAA